MLKSWTTHRTRSELRTAASMSRTRRPVVAFSARALSSPPLPRGHVKDPQSRSIPAITASAVACSGDRFG